MPDDATIVALRSDTAATPTAKREAPQEQPDRPGAMPSALEKPARSPRRPWRRWALFALLPLAVIVGCYWYITGGAVMSTDDSYVEADKVGLYILPFAIGNFLGPLLLGSLFDTFGRKPMIAITYTLAGVLLAVTGQLFQMGLLTATTQTMLWTVVFFFASAAASAAYLTVGECFPLEVRALTIALFYAFGTLLGGVGGPWLFGVLIEGGNRHDITYGYFLGAALMVIAALVELRLGVKAECLSLEDVAPPLSSLR